MHLSTRASTTPILSRRIAAAPDGSDVGAETELYRRLAPRVRLYGLKHLRDRDAASDLVQQVMMLTSSVCAPTSFATRSDSSRSCSEPAG
jgi:hypothetical protein